MKVITVELLYISVEHKINRAKSEDLKPLHKLLFKRQCKVRHKLSLHVYLHLFCFINTSFRNINKV